MTVQDVFHASRLIHEVEGEMSISLSLNELSSLSSKILYISEFLKTNPQEELEGLLSDLIKKFNDYLLQAEIQKILDLTCALKNNLTEKKPSSKIILTELRSSIEVIFKKFSLSKRDLRKVYEAKKVLISAENFDNENFHLADLDSSDFDADLLNCFEEKEQQELGLELHMLQYYLMNENLKKFFSHYRVLPYSVQCALNEDVHRRGGCICHLSLESDLTKVRSQSLLAQKAAINLGFYLATGLSRTDQEITEELNVIVSDLASLDAIG
ncbi:MAG: hypothetical protein WDZ28_05700 [Simkaniaceae bacterium]